MTIYSLHSWKTIVQKIQEIDKHVEEKESVEPEKKKPKKEHGEEKESKKNYEEPEPSEDELVEDDVERDWKPYWSKIVFFSMSAGDPSLWLNRVQPTEIRGKVKFFFLHYNVVSLMQML